MNKQWKYYNHALISTSAPHKEIQAPMRKVFKEKWGGYPY